MKKEKGATPRIPLASPALTGKVITTVSLVVIELARMKVRVELVSIPTVVIVLVMFIVCIVFVDTPVRTTLQVSMGLPLDNWDWIRTESEGDVLGGSRIPCTLKENCEVMDDVLRLLIKMVLTEVRLHLIEVETERTGRQEMEPGITAAFSGSLFQLEGRVMVIWPD